MEKIGVTEAESFEALTETTDLGSIHEAWKARASKRRRSLVPWQRGEKLREEHEADSGPLWDQIDEGLDVSKWVQKPSVQEHPEPSRKAEYQQKFYYAHYGQDRRNPIAMMTLEQRDAKDIDGRVRKGKHWYLRWLVGHPDKGGGGSALIRQAIVDARGGPIYVESSPSGVGFYQGKGFQLIDPIGSEKEGKPWGYYSPLMVHQN